MTTGVIAAITQTGLGDALRFKSVVVGKPLIGPKTVNIHFTNACNYRCEFCWYFSPWIKNHPKRKILDYKVLERTLEDCRQMGVDEMNLEGGEVTCYPYWVDAFRKVKKLGMRLVAYTNLDYPAKNLPVLCYADRLTVNFSATTEASFKHVHGPQVSLPRVLKNLDRLLAVRDKYGKPKIVLSFVIYNKNYKQLSTFLKMASLRKVDQVIIRFFKPTEEMRPLFFSQAQIDELRQTLEDALNKTYPFAHDLKKLHHLITKGKMFDNIVSLTPSAWHNDRLLPYDATAGKTTRCHVGWFFSYIDELGRVIAPCDNVGVCVAGNINERRYKDIWFKKGVLLDTLREASKGINTSCAKWQECRHCTYGRTNKILDEKIRGANAK